MHHSAPGVFDIVPRSKEEPWRESHLWNYVETQIRKIAREYAFQEIRTPLFERTELFQRGVGETSDIVSKEMYTFEDRGGRMLSLRPEGTAPVMRAFIEHSFDQQAPIHKLFYIAPMFRYERSQAGRYRQHHQFGAEVIGSLAPEQDVELIDLLYTLYQRLGLRSLKVAVNSIGSNEDRIKYRTALQEYFRQFHEQLSADSKRRLDTNPLRILDSKDPGDQKINENAPSILDYLDEASNDHFEQVKKLLDQLKIPYDINPNLVRGLDYYNKTVFEIVAGELGAQNSIAGGGRYDGLLKTLGGADLPSIGFGTGIERVIQTMLKQNVAIPRIPAPDVFLIAMGDAAKSACFTLLHDLRVRGIPAQMDFSGRKLGKSMQYANDIGAKFVAVVGDDEIASGEVDVKEMATGEKKKYLLREFTVKT
jgi:histidyl-tRNA synthetase